MPHGLRYGKPDPARLRIDEEGTCVRRLALLLAVIASTVATAVAGLTRGELGACRPRAA